LYSYHNDMINYVFQKRNLTRVILLLFFLSACASEKTLTVSEVWQNARELEGKQIRVRGQAVFSTVPYQGVTGCVPGGGREIKGELTLYDEDVPDPQYYGRPNPQVRIEFSADSLNCAGNTCRMTCGPFDPRGAKTFEFSGRLHSETRQGEMVLVLGELDLGKSYQVAGGALKPIPTGTFEYMFP
jgi:hypothetical protein